MGNNIGAKRKGAKVMQLNGTLFRVKPPAAADVLGDHPGFQLLDGAWSGNLRVGARERLDSARLNFPELRRGCAHHSPPLHPSIDAKLHAIAGGGGLGERPGKRPGEELPPGRVPPHRPQQHPPLQPPAALRRHSQRRRAPRRLRPRRHEMLLHALFPRIDRLFGSRKVARYMRANELRRSPGHRSWQRAGCNYTIGSALFFLSRSCCIKWNLGRRPGEFLVGRRRCRWRACGRSGWGRGMKGSEGCRRRGRKRGRK
ncbi:hypothetical protein BRADI_4g30527v3 [Brachypodium distachyon]|uniref:Uncharacterized protein n=1 Tax=Brachypodium distachyon TaxID=15368 RepID=A0A2K2CRE5_BRADI|nr:hypothetical protein BRADI_4g30527v3 [Brachypodium distachyon]